MPDGDLLRRIRNEIYHAKTLVRATRNHTKTTAAALHDAEERLDALIAELEEPHAKEAQGHAGNGTLERVADELASFARR